MYKSITHSLVFFICFGLQPPPSNPVDLKNVEFGFCGFHYCAPTKLKTLQQNSVQQYLCEENKARCVSMLWPKTPQPTPPRCLWGHQWSHSWACWAVRPRWRGTLWTGSWGTVRTVRCPPLPCSYCSMATRTTWWLLLSSWSSWPCRCSAPQTERQFAGRSCRTRCTGGPPWRSAGRPDQTGGGWCGCRRAPGSLPALRSSGSSSGRRRRPQWPSSGRLETRRECRWRRGFGRSHRLSRCPGWVEAVWLRWSRACSWQSSSRPGGCRRQTWGCSCTPVGWCFSHTTLSLDRSCGEQAHFDEEWVQICGQFKEKNKEKHWINNTFWLSEFSKLWVSPPLQTELTAVGRIAVSFCAGIQSSWMKKLMFGDDPTLIRCQVIESCTMSEYLFFTALNG